MPIDSASRMTETLASDDLDTHLGNAAALLAGATRVTVVCHENPDADTLGGGLALAQAVDRIGVTSEVVCSTGWPVTLDFLPGTDRIRRTPDQTPDVIVLVDCATIERTGSPVADWIAHAGATIVNVDHHASNPRYGDVPCVDEHVAATSEIVARLIDRLNDDMAPEAATLLLAGILHDTDGLRAEATAASTIRLVADLVDAGGDLVTVTRELFARRPVSALRLWGRVLAGLETHLGGLAVVGVLDRHALTAEAADVLDAEDLPDLIATARGAEIAILLREVGSSEVRVSIRTTASVNAATIARQFGGGGHEQAAGCTLPGDVDSAKERLLEASARALEEGAPA